MLQNLECAKNNKLLIGNGFEIQMYDWKNDKVETIYEMEEDVEIDYYFLKQLDDNRLIIANHVNVSLIDLDSKECIGSFESESMFHEDEDAIYQIELIQKKGNPYLVILSTH